jgi:hypothetical protein
MQDFAITIFGCVIGLLATIIVGGLPFHYRSEMKKARALAEAQFRGYKLFDRSGLLVLAGSTAQILDRYDTYTSNNGRVHDYVLTLFVLAPEGQHFLFKSNENGVPYVKPLAPNRARLVLKNKYREADKSET